MNIEWSYVYFVSHSALSVLSDGVYISVIVDAMFARSWGPCTLAPKICHVLSLFGCICFLPIIRQDISTLSNSLDFTAKCLPLGDKSLSVVQSDKCIFGKRVENFVRLVKWALNQPNGCWTIQLWSGTTDVVQTMKAIWNRFHFCQYNVTLTAFIDNRKRCKRFAGWNILCEYLFELCYFACGTGWWR